MAEKDPASALEHIDQLFSFMRAEMSGGIPGFEGDPLKDPKGAMDAMARFTALEQKKRARPYGKLLSTPDGLAMLADLAATTTMRASVPDLITPVSMETLMPLVIWNEAQKALVREMVAAARLYLAGPDNGEEGDDD